MKKQNLKKLFAGLSIVLVLVLVYICFFLPRGNDDQEQRKDAAGQVIAGDSFAAYIDNNGKLTVLFSDDKGQEAFDGATYVRFADDKGQLGALTTDGKYVTDYPDSPAKMKQLQDKAFQDAQENGGNVGLGGADPEAMQQLSEQTGLKYVTGNYPYSYIAVKQDGTLMAGGLTTVLSEKEAAWTSLEQILVADAVELKIGIREDGTRVYSEPLTTTHEADTADWDKLTDLRMCGEYLVGLRSDGTVCTESTALKKVVENWTDIVAIAAKNERLLGLKSDGTVLTAQTNGLEMSEKAGVESWTDIIAIDVNAAYCIGLKSDYTVVYAGDVPEGR